MFSADSVRFDETLKFTTPDGRMVYGGGGIMPDVYVPWDTVGVTGWFVQARDANLIYRYALEYADRHRDRINSIETVEWMRAFLDEDTRLLENFVRWAQGRGLKPDRAEIDRSAHLLLPFLRAHIARNSPLGEVGFYSEFYRIDNTILRALEVLEEAH
jgi:carboxyl-terminal processing protease